MRYLLFVCLFLLLLLYVRAIKLSRVVGGTSLKRVQIRGRRKAKKKDTKKKLKVMQGMRKLWKMTNRLEKKSILTRLLVKV